MNENRFCHSSVYSTISFAIHLRQVPFYPSRFGARFQRLCPLPTTCSWHRRRLSQLFAFFPWTQACSVPADPPSNWADPKTTSLSIKSEAASIQASLMAELRRVPGVHVYGGTAPLAAGVEKIPKQRNIIFNVDLEESDLKDLPSFKVPFDPERPLPFSSFDEICAALKPEDDKTQCIFNAKDVHAATTGRESSTNGKSEKGLRQNQYVTYFYFCPLWFKVLKEVLPKYSLKFLIDITHA